MLGAGLSRQRSGKAPPGKPAFQPYWGKPAVRNDREDRGNVGIIEARSAPRSYPTPISGHERVAFAATHTLTCYTSIIFGARWSSASSLRCSATRLFTIDRLD